MNIGDKVKAVSNIQGMFVPSIPAGAEGFVVGTSAWTKHLEIDFIVPGLFAGTRPLRATVEPGQVALV